MALMTTNDVLKINNSESLAGLIDECTRSLPEIATFPASPVEKTNFYTLALSGLPSTGFRAVGTDRTYSTAAFETKQVSCRYLDASWQAEVSLLQSINGDWDGASFGIATQTATHLRSAFFTLCKQIWYGTSNDAGGFSGIGEFISAVTNADTPDGKMEINANPNVTISDATSVFAIGGDDSISLCWGSNGKFDEDDVTIARIGTATQGRDFYTQRLGGWVGLSITNRYSAARIKNLTNAVGNNNGLDDELLFKLLTLFPAGQTPKAIFMNRYTAETLRASRTAVNPTGQPATPVDSVAGIPILITDAIANTETYTSSSSNNSGGSSNNSGGSSSNNTSTE